MGLQKYITKGDIVELVQLFDEDFVEADLKDVIMKLVNSKVDTYLIEHGKRPRNITDRFNLLWSAALVFALELLCSYGKVSWSTGDIMLERLNRTTYAYQRWQPMFFFATGASDPFKGLLPHMTYQMMGYAYVEAYCRDDFFKEYGSPVAMPILTRDETSRGWAWNLDEDYAEEADDESEYYDSDEYPWDE
jgi:hypothetical protein